MIRAYRGFMRRGHFGTKVIVMTVILLILIVLHVGIGTVYISPKAVVDSLLNHPLQAYQREIVWNLRLPRSLIAMCAGAMLGLAGAIMQALTRNPLAEPGVTGVSAGGILGIALWLVYAPNAVNHQEFTPLAALMGGVITVFVMYHLTAKMKNGPFVLILKGVILSAILASCTSLLLLQNQAQIPSVMLWMIGSLNAKVWGDWSILWPWALASVPVGLACFRSANLLQLGDEVAVGLGIHLQRSKMLLFLVAAFLTAGAVSVVGNIGFIGLIGPHIARKLVGNDSSRVLPMSMLLGSALLILADVFAQSVTLHVHNMGGGVPVGAITAMLGAPFFLYLVWRIRR